MARNSFESYFRTSKMTDRSEMVRNAIQSDFRTSKMAADFLAPPAERQRSFSNADSSVVRRLSSSVVCRRRPSSTFQLKAWFLKNCLITFFLFWHVASLGWYQCIVKIWIWLNHPKGHFERSERSNLAPFLLGGNFLKNCLITFSLFMQEASQGGY